MTSAQRFEQRTESSRDDWNTPEIVLDAVRRLGPIDLDPCSSWSNPTNARACYLQSDDGLTQPWSGGGLVFANPPYSRMKPWVAKMIAEANDEAEIVALVAARHGSKWFAQLNRHADARCDWMGRLTFKGAPHPARFNSSLFYFGERTMHFVSVFKPFGEVYVLNIGVRV